MFDEEFEEERQLTVQDYLRILYRGRWYIIISFVVVMIVTAYLTFTAPYIYQAGATVLIESTGSMERSLFGADYLTGPQSTLISNQIEILRSRKLAERTVHRLELSDKRDSLSIFEPDKDGNVASFRAKVGWIQSNLSIEQRKDTDVIDIRFSATSPFECAYITNIIAEEFKILNAETSQGEVSELRDFLERQVQKKEADLRQAEEKLRAFQEQKKVADLDDETAQLVQRLADAESMLEQARIELGSAEKRKESLNDQLEERRKSLGSDLGGTSTPYIMSLQNQLGEAVAERTKFMVAIESQAQNPNQISYESQLKVYDEKIKALRAKLEDESKKLTTSGMVKDAFELSQELITGLLQAETEIKALNSKIGALVDVVKDYNTRLEKLPATTLDLARLERDRKVQEETYIMMTSKLEETKITQAGKSGNVRLLDAAQEPMSPVRPNKRLNLMLGALIGLGLGIGLTFVIEYFDNTVRRIEDVERLGFNLLGTIPRIKQEKDRKTRKHLTEAEEARQIESRLITHFDPKSPVSESYRTLRTNLKFTVRLDEALKTILVTSAGPKEGKSTTVANLSITLAQMGSRVVLVDSDLRRPMIHSIFGLEKEKGLTNYIIDSLPLKDVVKPTIIEGLSVVTCGILPPNPSELLGSHRMEEFIGRLKENYDIILFDSPPVIAVTDAAVLCGKVDAAFFVISSGQTNRDAVTRAKSLLENVNAHVVGAVLNAVEMTNKFGGSYHYYYHYYSDQEESKATAGSKQ